MKKINCIPKKLAFACLVLFFGTQVFAQGRIDLTSNAKGVQISQSTLKGFQTTFSFNSIESTLETTEAGNFSILNMDNTISAGEIGTPSLPVARRLIGVPFGATPVVTVKNYTTTEYNLDDYGIGKIYPEQPSVRKDTKPEDIVFQYNEKAYQTRSYNEKPIATVEVLGTMRGIQIGALIVNPVSYNPSNNIIRVYNDIELEVTFEGADIALTEQTLLNTYSPYFNVVYKQLFNNRAINDVYDDHPDLWATPVKVLVIANRMFEEVMQPWLTWKTKKGFYLDVNYTDDIGTNASAIRSFIQTKYNEGLAAGQVPTFVIIFGDKAQVPASGTGAETYEVTDILYSDVDGDYFPDMYHSRMCCETTDQMTAAINKILQYEQYTMPDPSYLSNVLLIAGWDGSWNPKVGKPTIQYATHYYYNAEHGLDNVYEYLEQPYGNCYSNLNTGVSFVNYTAHGSETSWADPSLTISGVNALTNTDKYFWAMGNCCLAANWGCSGTCFGEAMLRAENKAAFSYIGACPSTYWWEDYYFGVGATHTTYQMPTYEESSMGVYDASFADDYNSLSSVPFVGNLSVCYAHANGYDGSVSDQYYWEAYHVLGDGSITPYHTNPGENEVSHLPTLPIGMDFYTVSADPGSYVGISKDGILYGAGEIGETGTADIPITPITSGGNVDIVVTHPQRQPYIVTVPAAAMDGPYIAVDGYALNDQNDQMDYGENINLSITIKNVGSEMANNMTATLTSESEYVTINSNTATIAELAADHTFTIENAFNFDVAVNVPNKEKILFLLTVTDGTDTWENKINIMAHAPEFEVESILTDVTEVLPGNTANLIFTIANKGTSTAYNTVLELISSSTDITFTDVSYTIEEIPAGETAEVTAEFTVAEDVELGSTYELTYIIAAGYYTTSGSYNINVGNIIEGFETGDFSAYNWVLSGNKEWTIVPENPNSGIYCAQSGRIGNSQNTDLELTVEVLADGELSFYKKVSSENNYDKLHFYIDGVEKGTWSGEVAWEQESYPITIGTHTFKWSYTKDYSVSNGSDCAWIDDIHFPPTNVVQSLEPVTNLIAEVENMTVTLTWTGVAEADEYIVLRDGEEVATQANTTFTEELTDGVYCYTVIAKNNEGAYSAPACVTVSVGIVSIEDNTTVNFSVYPNPAKDILYIDLGKNINGEYTLINSLGQQVINGTVNGKQQINVSNCTNGMYFLKIVVNGKVDVQKILLQ